MLLCHKHILDCVFIRAGHKLYIVAFLAVPPRKGVRLDQLKCKPDVGAGVDVGYCGGNQAGAHGVSLFGVSVV